VNPIESVLLLLLAAAVLVRAAELVRVPYPILLVAGGLVIGFTPGLPDLEVEPDVIFLIFLPPLLFSAGWWSSPAELKAEWRPLGLLAVGLVLVTVGVVAVVSHAIVPGMSWAAAFALGAVVGPTDPVAATATFARLGVPRRVRMLVESESMINDATALTALRVATGAATSGAFSAGHALGEFVITAAGGIAFGLALALVARKVLSHTEAEIGIFFSVLTAYGAYILAEEVHISGVLATVAAAVYLGWHANEFMEAPTRLSAVAFWRVLTLALEALLFVLLGLQAPVLADELNISELLVQALVVALAVVAVRMLWVFFPRGAVGETWQERVAVGWSGMRGAISLAAALAVPLEIEERPVILLITFGVIGVTLLGQGLTLPIVLKALRLPPDNQLTPDRAVAQLETAQAALDRLDELEEEGDADQAQIDRLRELYRGRFAVCVAVLGGHLPAADARKRSRSVAEVRRDVIDSERQALMAMRNDGRVTPEVMRALERDLDLQETRLS
jgi:CPA1 family monovalent cation:H+ antiporter